MNRIKTLRKDRGWSMEQLAEACNPPTTASQINKLEKGQRKLNDEWLERLAKALGVKPYELLGQWTAEAEDEQKLLERYRRLSLKEKKNFQGMFEKWEEE